MTSRGSFFFATGLAGALAAGWIGFPLVLYEPIDQPLQFSHATHTAQSAGMACEDCHGFAPDGRFAGVPPVAKCAECHQEPLGASAPEKALVDQYVRPGREIPWLIYAREPDNVFFSHASHVKLGKLACERCHGPHAATRSLRPLERNRITGYGRDVWGGHIARVNRKPWEGRKMSDCSGCHTERRRPQSCLDCHK